MLHIRMSIFCHYIILFYEGGLITWCRFCHLFSVFLVLGLDLIYCEELKLRRVKHYVILHFTESVVMYVIFFTSHEILLPLLKFEDTESSF